jgi:hypothetical protein
LIYRGVEAVLGVEVFSELEQVFLDLFIVPSFPQMDCSARRLGSACSY